MGQMPGEGRRLGKEGLYALQDAWRPETPWQMSGGEGSLDGHSLCATSSRPVPTSISLAKITSTHGAVSTIHQPALCLYSC